MIEIKFYKVNEPYGFFSNFAAYPIFIKGNVWKTVEHFFQASKFTDGDLRDKIKSIDSPMDAALEGRIKENRIIDNWDDVKEVFMLEGLQAKFLQHPKLRIELLNTKNAILIEHTTNDSYWGDGGDGSGKNRLGELLMNVRAKIKEYSNDVSLILPPWIAFPNIDQYDLFWRMGLGEDYLHQWSRYYLNSDKKKYQDAFPEPQEWVGIYSED